MRVFFSQGLKNSIYLKYKYFVTLYIYFVTFDQFITFRSNISEYYCFFFLLYFCQIKVALVYIRDLFWKQTNNNNPNLNCTLNGKYPGFRKYAIYISDNYLLQLSYIWNCNNISNDTKTMICQKQQSANSCACTSQKLHWIRSYYQETGQRLEKA